MPHLQILGQLGFDRHGRRAAVRDGTERGQQCGGAHGSGGRRKRAGRPHGMFLTIDGPISRVRLTGKRFQTLIAI